MCRQIFVSRFRTVTQGYVKFLKKKLAELYVRQVLSLSIDT